MEKGSKKKNKTSSIYSFSSKQKLGARKSGAFHSTKLGTTETARRGAKDRRVAPKAG